MESRDKLSYVKAGGREPRPSRRAPVPLFERLTASSDPSREAVEPLRSLTPQLAFESVRAELNRLLNTRTRPGWSPAPGQILTATEYGMPDFAHLSAADVVERDGFAGLIGRVIEAFEPRLKQVRVTLLADPANQRALLGAIQGRIRIGIIDQPVSFPLELHPRNGDATVELPQTTA